MMRDARAQKKIRTIVKFRNISFSQHPHEEMSIRPPPAKSGGLGPFRRRRVDGTTLTSVASVYRSYRVASFLQLNEEEIVAWQVRDSEQRGKHWVTLSMGMFFRPTSQR